MGKCIKKCKLDGDICIGCNRTMTEIKKAFEDIHPAWPAQPPIVEDNLPPADAGIKPKKKLCPRYYKQCFKTECNESIIPSGECVD